MNICYHYSLLPFYGDGGTSLKGVQIALVQDADSTGEYRDWVIINTLDQEASKYLHKYHNDILRFGIITLYNDKEQSPDNYYILASANVKEE